MKQEQEQLLALIVEESRTRAALADTAAIADHLPYALPERPPPFTSVATTCTNAEACIGQLDDYRFETREPRDKAHTNDDCWPPVVPSYTAYQYCYKSLPEDMFGLRSSLETLANAFGGTMPVVQLNAEGSVIYPKFVLCRITGCFVGYEWDGLLEDFVPSINTFYCRSSV